jgi:hypothetical protein
MKWVANWFACSICGKPTGHQRKDKDGYYGYCQECEKEVRLIVDYEEKNHEMDVVISVTDDSSEQKDSIKQSVHWFKNFTGAECDTIVFEGGSHVRQTNRFKMRSNAFFRSFLQKMC